MAAHADLAEATGRGACPCDPRSPWQRGGPTGALAASSASSSPRARGSPTSPTRGRRGSRTCRTAGRGRRWGGGPPRRRWRSCCLRHLRPVQRPPDSAGLGLPLLGCCSGSARLIHRSTAKGSRAYSALLLPTPPHVDDLQGWKNKRLTCSFIVLWHQIVIAMLLSTRTYSARVWVQMVMSFLGELKNYREPEEIASAPKRMTSPSILIPRPSSICFSK